MPPKARPEDWDRYFGSNAPQRGGPLRVLASILTVGFALGLLGLGAFFGLSYRERIQQASSATQTVVAQVLATRTVTTRQTQDARATARVADQPTVPPEVILGAGSVLEPGGNLRSEPRIAPETVIGLIYPGDQVVFLEQQLVGGDPWFRVRVTGLAGERGEGGVSTGTEGWASATLLSPPAP